MLTEILHCNPLNDVFFKYVFGRDENRDILLAFINAVLGLAGAAAFTRLEFIDREQDADCRDGKVTRMDVYVKANDGTRINIEVQVVRQRDFIERMLYYWATIYQSLESGSDYGKLQRVIVIAIMDFREPLLRSAAGEAHSVVQLINRATGKAVTNRLEMHFIELPKQRSFAVPGMALPEQWMAYLNARRYKYDEGIRRELAMANPAIANAYAAERKFLADERERIRYIMQEKVERDAINLERTRRLDREEAIAESRAEGRAEGVYSVMYNMLDDGMEKSQVARMTGIPLDEVERIQVVRSRKLGK